MSLTEAQQFFTSYRDAFNRLDGDAVADLWHSCSRLHWTLKRADGSVLQQFHTTYQLMRTATGLKVLLATAYEEDIQELKRHAAQ